MSLWQKLKKFMKPSPSAMDRDLLSTPEGTKEAEQRLRKVGEQLSEIRSLEKYEDEMHAKIEAEENKQIQMYKENIEKIDRMQVKIQVSRAELAEFNAKLQERDAKLQERDAKLQEREKRANSLMKSIEIWEANWEKHVKTNATDLNERQKLKEQEKLLTKQLEALEEEQRNWRTNTDSSHQS